MASRELETWMWSEACALLERAERLQRSFFEPRRYPAARSTWEPPVDLYETERDIVVTVALPGVAPGDVELVFDGRTLLVAGMRRPPFGESAWVRRLEIPHGRFERRLEFPNDGVQLVGQELAHGCLMIRLRKQ